LPAREIGEWISIRAQSQRPISGSGPESGAASFLRAYFLEQLPRLTGSMARRARQALHAIEDYELSTWTRSPGLEDSSGPGPRMRRAVLDFLVRKGGIPSFDWLRLTSSWRPESQRPPCFTCGEQSVTYRVTPRVPGTGERRIHVCPQCGVTADLPVHARPPEITVEGAALRIRGLGSRDPWRAALLLAPPNRSAHRWWDWPSDESGAPAARFEPPKWPRGPQYVVLFHLEGATLCIVRRPRDLEAAPQKTGSATMA
jgi:hypothetical protein